MNTATELLAASHEVYARAEANPAAPTRPPVYKAVGISLAIASGVFIGVSFVLKKMGLLRANVKYNEEAGEGYGYLKNAYWWGGMTLMIIGEICNFVAYAFVDAILVTPLGALSVVITTILSAIFLKERLSFVGKIGCFICIIGSVTIVMNAPEQSSAGTIQEMKHFVIAPGFLSYAGVVIIGCAFIALWAGPRYGKKSMLVYLSVCSLVGGLSVVATQGLGAAVVAQAAGTPQFNQWFLYVLLVFVIATLLTEIIYLNKALNIFNAALVTPTYYVFFTSSTIVTSAILFRGFKGTPTSITTVVMGFLQICSGVILLQLSKSAKDIPDAAVFSGDLDQVRTVAEQEQPESEPKADAIRGAAAIIRRISVSRQKMEVAEAKKVHEERMKDQMEPIGENEQVEWDGLRRRKTLRVDSAGGLQRRKTLHPPLGLTHFPDGDDNMDSRSDAADSNDGAAFHGGFMHSLKRRAQSTLVPGQRKTLDGTPDPDTVSHPADLTQMTLPSNKGGLDDVETHYSHHPDGGMEMSHVYGLPSNLQQNTMDGSGDGGATPPGSQQRRPIAWAQDVDTHARPRSSLAPNPPRHSAKRQFSFTNVFHRNKNDVPAENTDVYLRPTSRKSLGSSHGNKDHSFPGDKSATEEERLGLVKGDSTNMLPLREDHSDDDGTLFGNDPRYLGSFMAPSPVQEDEKEIADYEARREQWSGSGSSPELLNVVPTTARRKRFDEDSESDRERERERERERDRDLMEVKEWDGGGGGKGGARGRGRGRGGGGGSGGIGGAGVGAGAFI